MIYLYVKQHQITGLKYFGRTTMQDPYKYTGSGKYWKSHLAKHGKKIDTLQVWSFDSMQECSSFATKFSQENDIVKSDAWANLIAEDGYMGRVRGESVRMNPEATERARKRMKEHNPMKILRTNNGSFQKGHAVISTPETNVKKSIAKIGALNPNYGRSEISNRLNLKATCPKCGITTNLGNLKRWHTNC